MCDALNLIFLFYGWKWIYGHEVERRQKKHLLLSHTQTDYANKMGIIIAFSAVAVQRIMFCNKMKSLGFFYGHFS